VVVLIVFISSENEARDRALVGGVAQRVRCLNIGRRDRDASAEPIENRGFAKFRGNEVEGVDNPLLPDAIDASDPLLESARIPRQLEIHHHPATVVQVEPFGSGVGGKEDDAGRRSEDTKDVRAFLTPQSAMKDGRGPRHRALDVQQRVAILGEDHDGLTCAT
jgi:hypothetical protein